MACATRRPCGSCWPADRGPWSAAAAPKGDRHLFPHGYGSGHLCQLGKGACPLLAVALRTGVVSVNFDRLMPRMRFIPGLMLGLIVGLLLGVAVATLILPPRASEDPATSRQLEQLTRQL